MGKRLALTKTMFVIPTFIHRIMSYVEQDMLARAYKNRDKAKVDNVVFVKSPITAIDLPDASADCIISNCVINLVPEFDKPTVFKEMFRLLKPGGRVAVSDILAKKPMPESIQRDIALYVGCIAGASQVEQYNQYLHDAGFIGTMTSEIRTYGAR